MQASITPTTVLKTAILASLMALTLQGCVVRPVRPVAVVRPCPPGMHLGSYEHRCFAN